MDFGDYDIRRFAKSLFDRPDDLHRELLGTTVTTGKEPRWACRQSCTCPLGYSWYLARTAMRGRDDDRQITRLNEHEFVYGNGWSRRLFLAAERRNLAKPDDGKQRPTTAISKFQHLRIPVNLG